MSTRAATWHYQPTGSLCLRCRYRPARPSAKFPDRATLYCSDRCRSLAGSQRDRARQTRQANAIRVMLGLPDGRGAHFTLPELDAIQRRLARLLPYGGLARYPARRGQGRGSGALTTNDLPGGTPTSPRVVNPYRAQPEQPDE